MSNFY